MGESENPDILIPVILSGGAGSRLWPVSREQHPKPFMRLADNESFLQKAFQRAAELPGVTKILTVTNREFYFKSQDEYKAVNQAKLATGFILEPFGRNTAPAVATAAVQINAQYGPNALMLILTADHLISNQENFATAVEQAVSLAKQNNLVTFGIIPTSPETGYGYIEADGDRVKRFVEKPSLAKAESYLQQGNYFWNSGMFCFKAGTVLESFRQHAPEVLSAVEECFPDNQLSPSAKGEQTTLEIDADLFAAVPDISIDYAVMEKADNLAMVSSDLGWSDIGSWDAVSELIQNDDAGNAIVGEAMLHDVSGCYIQSTERLVGAVGVENLIIVDTPDALLVADRSRAQEVKHIAGKLKESGHESYKIHKTVYRPWGSYTVLEESKNFKIKRIVVKPGASLSLQMHHHRSEHWVVVSGMAEVVVGDKTTFLSENQSTFVPAGHKHRLSNPGMMDVVMIEVQSGQYLGEDDIVRFDDNYGRS